MLHLILIHITLFLIGSICCIISFQTPLFASIDIFFYRGLILILFWGVIITVCMGILRVRRKSLKLTVRDLLLLFISFCCIQTVFFTHVPVTAERSVSVFMLGYMSDSGNREFTKEELEDAFISRYVQDYGAFDKRFHEQLATGTIEKDGDRYRITKSGTDLMHFYETIAKLYGIDDRLIHPGEETADAQTDSTGAAVAEISSVALADSADAAAAEKDPAYSETHK